MSRTTYAVLTVRFTWKANQRHNKREAVSHARVDGDLEIRSQLELAFDKQPHGLPVDIPDTTDQQNWWKGKPIQKCSSPPTKT